VGRKGKAHTEATPFSRSISSDEFIARITITDDEPSPDLRILGPGMHPGASYAHIVSGGSVRRSTVTATTTHH